MLETHQQSTLEGVTGGMKLNLDMQSGVTGWMSRLRAAMVRRLWAFDPHRGAACYLMVKI